jgi:hypothetical protein
MNKLNFTPQSKLPSVFSSMSASYKAYWFIGILECLVEEGLVEIPIRRICARMLVNAWYPVHFFKLHFGAQDLISQHNVYIKEYQGLAADISKSDLLEILTASIDKVIVEKVMHFRKQVPFRFLSPWISYKSDAQVEKHSQLFMNDAPYSISRERNVIVINKDWIHFFKSNYKLLIDYGYWVLAQYVQTKNPGVPDIPGKLIKLAVRGSLLQQRKYWQIVFDELRQIRCIYTQELLSADKFAVEHYIPWSFTTHDLIWNLIPADPSINSTKSNRLPTRRFLEPFVEIQKAGLKVVLDKSPRNRLLEDYAVFGVSVPELLALPQTRFYELYDNQISPQLQLAHQLGFAYWNHSNQ